VYKVRNPRDKAKQSNQNNDIGDVIESEPWTKLPPLHKKAESQAMNKVKKYDLHGR